jgi:hypothetical protein
MIWLKVSLVAQTHHTQRRGYSVLAGRKNDNNQQHLHMALDRLGKQRSESYNQAHQFEGQCQHPKTSLGGVDQSAYAAFRLLFKARKCIKSSLVLSCITPTGIPNTFAVILP